MKISKKAEYAIRAVTAMSRAPLGTTFSIQDIAQREHIPLKFLEQILLALKNGGLLRSKRGVGGGYQLNVPANQLTLRQVIEPIDGPFDPITCLQALGKPKHACECGIPGGCALAKTFHGLSTLVQGWLSGTTIADVIAKGGAGDDVSFDI